MHRPTVLIVSDESKFSAAITSRWARERSVPCFTLRGSNCLRQLASENFDLAIAAGLPAELLEPSLECLRARGKPLVHLGCSDRHSRKGPNQICLPTSVDWEDLLVTLLSHILDCEWAAAEVSRLREITAELEHQALLGRYMLEMRHNVNNALTSILGNSELMLLDPEQLSPAYRGQLETIRNMGLRMNEIMQRFSSLEKEMQLVEQQSFNKTLPKTASSGAAC